MTPGPDAAATPSRPQPLAPPMVRRGRRLALLQGFAIFASGLVIGAAGAYLALDAPPLGSGTPVHRMDPARMAAHTRARLGLTAEETAAVEQVFADHVQRLGALRDALGPKFEQERARLTSAMRDVLTAEHFAQWKEGFERRCARHRHRGPRGNGSGRHRHGARCPTCPQPPAQKPAPY